MAKYETLIPRFVSYVKKNTRSDENSTTIPSTQSQVEFAKDLMAELKKIGMQNVRLNDQSGYVFATLPSNLPAGKTADPGGNLRHGGQRRRPLQPGEHLCPQDAVLRRAGLLLVQRLCEPGLQPGIRQRKRGRYLPSRRPGDLWGDGHHPAADAGL